jgi:hypothetical protein
MSTSRELIFGEVSYIRKLWEPEKGYLSSQKGPKTARIQGCSPIVRADGNSRGLEGPDLSLGNAIAGVEDSRRDDRNA